jgi:predicted acylesterase/phospholipase RssA
MFERLVTWAAYIYLRRVPIVIGAMLALFPLAALLRGSPVRSLLQNLFLLTTEGTFWSTVAALVLSWSLLLTGRLVLLNGEERFSLPQRLSAAELTWHSVFGIISVAFPLIIAPFTQHSDFRYTQAGWVWRVAAVLGGLLFAYLLAFVGLYAAVLLAPAGTQDAADTFPAPPVMRNWLHEANGHDILPVWFPRLCLWLRKRLPPGLWAGYLDPASGLPWGGHWLGFMFFLATGCLYFGIDVYRRTYLGESTPIPALAFVLLLVLNVNWVLSFLAFLLDRYRIPLLVPLLILCILGSHAPSSDHYYAVQHGVVIDPICPEQVLDARSQQDKPIVVIATAGGGIQAATWTAQVLAGLDEQTHTWNLDDQTHMQKSMYNFADSVTLISSVSGGAVGSMFYLNLFHPDRRESFDQEALKRLTEVVSESSLDDIAWALVYRDIPRIFFPYVNRSSEEKLFDRGFMLEESWRNRGNIQANLSNWRLGVAQGLRPAAIFNSTIAERGEPLVLGTTDVKVGAEKTRRRSFYELYPNTDLPVVTAVRLAATFPYVTPAARALSTKPEYHMVDGGYYDNYGISSLIAWLDEAFTGLQREKKPLPDILVIQIRSFPDDALKQPTNKGWFFQVYAPLDALLSVRTTAQLVRDREELALFAQRWAKVPEQGSRSDRVHFASFQFQGHDAPLSWSMNQKQKDEIGESWSEIKDATPTNPDLLVVHCFFDPAYSGCPQLPKKGPW